MFTGLLATILFCLAGPVTDGKCEDGSDAIHVEMHVMTATNCDWSNPDHHVLSVLPRNCRLENVVEINRNGQTIAKIPADVLTPKEGELMLQTFFGLR